MGLQALGWGVQPRLLFNMGAGPKPGQLGAHTAQIAERQDLPRTGTPNKQGFGQRQTCR